MLIGLGTLAKITFVAIAGLPTLWSLAMAMGWPREGALKKLPGIAARFSLALAVGVAVAAPWYLQNFAAVVHHAQIGASATAFYYPHWIVADISSGPGVLIGGLGLAGMPHLRPPGCGEGYSGAL